MHKDRDDKKGRVQVSLQSLLTLKEERIETDCIGAPNGLPCFLIMKDTNKYEEEAEKSRKTERKGRQEIVIRVQK